MRFGLREVRGGLGDGVELGEGEYETVGNA